MNINLIKQEESDGCVVACVAMLLGLAYKEAGILFKEIPVQDRDTMRVLTQKNIYCEPIYGVSNLFYPDNIYMLGVASLNFMETSHMIIMTVDKKGNAKVFDPSTKKTHKFISEYNVVCSFQIWDYRK